MARSLQAVALPTSAATAACTLSSLVSDHTFHTLFPLSDTRVPSDTLVLAMWAVLALLFLLSCPVGVSPGTPFPWKSYTFAVSLIFCQHFACPIWVLLSLPLVLKPHSGCHCPSSFWCWRKVERQDILTVTGLL